MNSNSACLVLAAALLLSGCNSNSSSDKTDDSWESPPPAEATAQAVNDEKKPASLAEPVADGAMILKGSAFQIDGTSETVKSKGDDFRMAHYFAASAPVEIKTSTTQMQSHIVGDNVNGAVPLVGIRVVSTSGTYSDKAVQPRPVDGEQTLTDPMELAPGSYKVTLSYYKDTGNGARPAVTLKQITFK